jgi:acyl-coenzyme A synthetase/AMP-(fatty) acid ligase
MSKIGLTILVLQSLYKLARIVVMPSFDLTRFCKAIQLHRVSVAYIVPPVAAMLVQSDLPKRHDMSSVLYMVSGAAKLDTELIESLYSHCNVKLLQGYGLTETSPAAFMMVGARDNL